MNSWVHFIPHLQNHLRSLNIQLCLKMLSYVIYGQKGMTQCYSQIWIFGKTQKYRLVNEDDLLKKKKRSLLDYLYYFFLFVLVLPLKGFVTRRQKKKAGYRSFSASLRHQLNLKLSVRHLQGLSSLICKMRAVC